MAEQQRVIVTGATGLIGKALCRRLIEKGYAVVVFSREPETARQAVPGAAEYVAWTPGESGPWVAAVDGAYAVISLAGASIAGKRWSPQYKQQILNTRTLGTRGLVKAMAQASRKPRVLISGSAVGYYGFRDDTPLDEAATPGDDFLANVVKAWEAEAVKAETLGIRTVLIRTGIVLDKQEGALPQMMLPFRLFAGGPVLPGTQWFSWVHLADEVGIILWALEDERVRGPVNATAPEPATNKTFSSTLGKVMGRPAWAPVPGFALRIIVGEAEQLLTTGQRVLPKKAQDLGYQFQFPTLEPALRNILS
nr:TIGR01777 family protein [uncultured bacterium]